MRSPPASIAASSGGNPASPSPLSTQSIAPSPCSRIAGGDERGAVPADADENARQPRLRRLREVDDLRNVRQVVAREGDDIGPPSLDQAQEESRCDLDLQIDQPHLVPGGARRRGDQLQPERLEPQEYLCVHQRAGMDAENFHTESDLTAVDTGPKLRRCRVSRNDNRALASARAPETQLTEEPIRSTSAKRAASKAAWRCRREFTPGLLPRAGSASPIRCRAHFQRIGNRPKSHAHLISPDAHP